MSAWFDGRRPKVAFVSQPEYFRFMYEHDLDEFADVVEFRLQMGLRVEDYAPLIKYQADYNIFFRAEFVPDGVLEQLHGFRIALSSEPFPRLVDGRYEYTFDSIHRYFVFRAIRSKPLDYVFHYDAGSIPFLKWDGLYVSGEFPFPVSTSVYSHRSQSRQWDIFFIGRSTAHRERYFGHLKHRHKFLHVCHGIWGSDLVDYMCSSAICLNVHAEREVSWEPRMQMMLSCGVFVISEKITPNRILRPGIDYIEINSPQELHEAVDYYLNHEQERQMVACNGAKRIREMLDSRTNFRRLLEDIRAEKCGRFAVGRGAIVLNSIRWGREIWNRVRERLT